MIDEKEEVNNIGVYIHIPFCLHKCGYCSFNSYDKINHLIPSYIETLKEEIKSSLLSLRGRSVTSIYFGGGTPTSIPINSLREILELSSDLFSVTDDAEISIEANPVTVSDELMSSLRSAGFNRISLGIQSLNSSYLHILERLHSPEEALSSFESARSAGFDNISCDMMFGILGANPSGWEDDLNSLLSLSPEHISAYNLTIEDGSRFYGYLEGGLITLPEDEAEREMFETTMDMLADNGYNQYEISNFSKLGRESRHNKIYWHNGEYLGFGAGAFSYIAGERRKNDDSIDAYIEAIRTGVGLNAYSEKLTPESSARETIIMNLRLMEGIDRKAFRSRFGDDPYNRYRAEIDGMVGEGLLSVDGNRIRLTRQGIIFSNHVFTELV